MSFAGAVSEYMNLGLTAREAAAFAANEGVESNFDATRVNTHGGGRGAHGLLQHRGVRYQNLLDFAAARGKPHTDPSINRAFNVWEYKNDPQNAWGDVDLPSLIRDAPNDYEGAKLFRKHYERPGTDEAGYGRLASYFPEMPEGYEKFDAVAQEADRQSLEGFASGMQKSSYHYHNIAEWMQREGAKTEEGMLRFEQERTGMGPRPRNETPPGYQLPGTAGAPPSSSARTGAGAGPASKSSSSDEASTPENWQTRLAKALFPNHENPNTGMGDVLSALSTGLGQMSTGQAVDLSPVFTRMAQRRRDALYQENAEADRAMRQQEFGLAQAKHAADLAAAQGTPMPPEILQAASQQPGGAALVAGLTSRDKKVREKALDTFYDGLAPGDDAPITAEKAAAYGDVIRAVQADDMGKVADLVAEHKLDPEEVRRLQLTASNPEDVRQGNMLYDLNPHKYPGGRHEAIEEAARVRASLGMDEVRQANFKEGREFSAALRSNALEQSELGANVALFRDGLLEAHGDGKGKLVSGKDNAKVNSALSRLERWVPQKWADKAKQELGIDNSTYQELAPIQKFMVLQAARSMMKGQGEVTDSERKELAASIFEMDMEFEAQMAALDRLEILDDMDRARFGYYTDHKGDEFHSGFEAASAHLAMHDADTITALTRAKHSRSSFVNRHLSQKWKDEWNPNMFDTKEDYLLERFPVLTADQYAIGWRAVDKMGKIWYNSTANRMMYGDSAMTDEEVDAIIMDDGMGALLLKDGEGD